MDAEARKRLRVAALIADAATAPDIPDQDGTLYYRRMMEPRHECRVLTTHNDEWMRFIKLCMPGNVIALLDALDAAEARADAAAGGRWIACADRLPLGEEAVHGCGKCLVLHRRFGVQAAEYSRDPEYGWEWMLGPYEEPCAQSEITHWCEIPEPPASGAEAGDE